MKVLSTTYVAYENDAIGLPVAIFDSIVEMSAFLCCSVRYLQLCIATDTLCKGYQVKCYYGLD